MQEAAYTCILLLAATQAAWERGRPCALHSPSRKATHEQADKHYKLKNLFACVGNALLYSRLYDVRPPNHHYHQVA
jgi:hypothetical protein